MVQQSTIFPIYLRTEYRDSNALNRFQSDAQRAAQAAKREFQGVGSALEEALSRPRTAAGSLDLGIDELRELQRQQQAAAIGARELAEATRRAATASGQFDGALSKSTRATFELANAEEASNREMIERIQLLERIQAELNQSASATDALSAANRRGARSAGAIRNASVQAGQQLQDITVQLEAGTRATTVFSQQVPQLAFALSGLRDSTNATQRRIGALATFLSGPWGAAIFAGTAVLGPYIASLFQSGEAADEATDKTFNFVDGLDVLRISANDAKSAIDQLSGSLRSAIDLQGDFIRGEIAIARQAATALQTQIDADQAELGRLRQERRGPGATLLPEFFGPSAQDRVRERELADRLERNRALLPGALDAAAQASIAEANRNLAESADPLLRQINNIDDAIARLNRRREQTVIADDPLRDGNVSQADFERQLGRLAQERAALEEQQREQRRSSRSGGSRGDREARRAAREAEQLGRFGDQTEERVTRIADKYSEQTRLIQQSLQATRELDTIIVETNRRMAEATKLTAAQRDQFIGIRDAAEDAKTVIEEALERPFEDLRLESERRLEIDRLLAQGRVDEAAALQEVVRIEQQFGEEVRLRAQVEGLILQGRNEEAAVLARFVEQYADLKDEARLRVIEEQQLVRLYQDQAEVFETQIDAVRTIRSDLQAILSGRDADLIGNFRQALRDIQGARLFEDLFGESFRAIEDELRSSSPQGRANEDYRRAVEKTAETTEAANLALEGFTDAVNRASAGISGAAANDNGLGNEIFVSGQRVKNVGIEPRSIEALADRFAAGIVTPLTKELEDLLGPRFAAQLGTVLTGALSGLVRGGSPGAVLGGLGGLSSEIFGPKAGITRDLGAALSGAASGTSIAGLSNVLGLGGSTSGAQIGGAVGGLLSKVIPGGDIIGAVAGNFLGSVFGGTKRGSAILNGSEITGFFGNSSSRKEAASGLGGSVLEAVNRIAEELGASVNSAAGSVSIGVRKDSINVDPQGRGFTKTSKFPDIRAFGDDAEAAIAFAVQDLINDGVISGLSASENRLLRAGNDIEAALQDVLDFRGVFDRLAELRDPLGFAIDQLNDEFEDLIDLFERAGASSEEFAELEELYNLERAQAIEEATDRVVSSLQSLLSDLTIGDNGLSLRTRRANALGDFNDLAARVQAGDSTAFDEFADISRQLLDIERQLFGSTQSYFDRLAQVTALTDRAIGEQTNVTSIAEARSSPFDDQLRIDRSIDIQTVELSNRLDQLNRNFLAFAERGSVSGGSIGFAEPRRFANF